MKDGGGNDGLWTPRKTEGRFSSVAHSPWKSLARFPHSHRRDEKSRGKVESPKAGLPTFPRHDWIWITEFKIKKEAWRRSFAPPPGSSFD